MRCGYTTGSCAAAATKAALLFLTNGNVSTNVNLTLPQGESLTIPIEKVELTKAGAQAAVIKDSGDDPDITNGMSVLVDVMLDDSLDAVQIEGGIGVGIVTKAGLSTPVGMAAINPGPRKMILAVVKEILGEHKSCRITISLPDGEKLARRTLNPILGIQGGLSIIGTTGIVRPMSEEAFKDSLVPQISVAKAAGYDTLIFVPGKIGEEAAVHNYHLPPNAIVQTSNFIGYMLEKAVEHKVKKVLLFGHLGKIVKIAAGIFHTHNRIADARLETLCAYLALLGAPAHVISTVLNSTTTEAAMPIIKENHLDAVYRLLAERASLRAERYVFQDLSIGTAMVTLKGEILGYDQTAKQIGEEFGWNIK